MQRRSFAHWAKVDVLFAQIIAQVVFPPLIFITLVKHRHVSTIYKPYLGMVQCFYLFITLGMATRSGPGRCVAVGWCRACELPTNTCLCCSNPMSSFARWTATCVLEYSNAFLLFSTFSAVFMVFYVSLSRICCDPFPPLPPMICRRGPTIAGRCDSL